MQDVKNNIYKEIDKEKKALVKVFTDELIVASEAYYASKGVSPAKFKTSTLIQTLKGEVSPTSLTLIAKEYIEYLDKGRKPGTRKVPIAPLLSWMRKIGLPASNSLAFRIQSSIYKRGIKPRNFVNRSLDKVIKAMDKIVDKALETHLKQL